MSAISKIEWTDRTWNPVRGCSIVSPGCVNCYAMKQAHRFSWPSKRDPLTGATEEPGGPYEGLTKQTKAGPQWTGQIRTVDAALLEPLSGRKPARVFVNSMSDLFHEGVPDEFIDRVFAVMALPPDSVSRLGVHEGTHTFQILTKRAERMRAYISTPDRPDIVKLAASRLIRESGRYWGTPYEWPLPNVWLGVSAEDQQRADERIPYLTETPAALRFVSAEPLRGPIDFSSPVLEVDCADTIDWVIVGGESGPGSRPFDIAWARSIVQQCRAAGVPTFVKQLGSVPVMDEAEWRSEGMRLLNARNDKRAPAGTVPLRLGDRKGGDMDWWPVDLRVREFPRTAVPAC